MASVMLQAKLRRGSHPGAAMASHGRREGSAIFPGLIANGVFMVFLSRWKIFDRVFLVTLLFYIANFNKFFQ